MRVMLEAMTRARLRETARGPTNTAEPTGSTKWPRNYRNCQPGRCERVNLKLIIIKTKDFHI